MHTLVDVLWVSSALQSAEHCTIRTGSASTAITSTTLLPFGERPARLDYSIDIDRAWHTRSLRAHLSTGDTSQVMSLTRATSGWSMDGVARPDLGACIDVDLGWTPATNLLPLSRVKLEVGESVTTTAAWLRFPELDVVPSEQTYTRLAADRVRYQSATFEAELAVTDHGVVTRYGDDLWVAASLHRQGL